MADAQHRVYGVALTLALLYGRRSKMLGHPHRYWFVLAAFAIANDPFSPALAQDTTPQPEAPAEEEPKEVTIADFAIQASAVEERLERIRSEIALFDVAAEVGASLDSIEAERGEVHEHFGAVESRRMMSSEVNTLRTKLEVLDARTDRQIDKLSVYANDLETLDQQNDEDLELWTKALRSARRGEVPKSVVDRAASNLQGLREGKKELAKRIGEVLELQSRTLDVRQDVRAAEQAITAAQRAQTDSIFKRQGTALWDAEALPDPALGQEGYDIRFSWPAVERTLRSERGTWIFALLLVLGLGWLLRRVRSILDDRVEKRQQDGAIPWEDRAIEAVQHPWAAALLLTLFAFRFLEPDRVVDAIILSWLVAIPLWFLVCKEMVPASLRNVLIGLGALGTLNIVVALVSGHPGVERALLLVELLLAGAGAAWLIRFFRTVDVPKRVRQNF